MEIKIWGVKLLFKLIFFELSIKKYFLIIFKLNLIELSFIFNVLILDWFITLIFQQLFKPNV